MAHKQNSKVAVKIIPWSSSVDEHMTAAKLEKQGLTVNYYRNLVRKGKVLLLGLFFDEEHVATFVSEIRRGELGNELFVMLTVANDANKKVFNPLLSIGDSLALSLGCNELAFETSRKGSIALAEKQGYELQAYRMVKKVGGEV